jgi:hypothetical protein
MVPPFYSLERSRGRGVEVVGEVGDRRPLMSCGSSVRRGFGRGRGRGRGGAWCMRSINVRLGEGRRRREEGRRRGGPVVADGHGRKGRLEVGGEADSGPWLSARGREGEGEVGQRDKLGRRDDGLAGWRYGP